ncbi:helix-turn-helix domain-containing protein [Aequorivita echinoideorum]|uniref:Helix-turn-helix domain-containing protein n=1 Tax=Aequorivita echinoideorum TaxID=1549647 RepID=A0ABS5S0U1_9FLAO|nr:helix-turn-helix domain-containing protein [Aequorivita echinoideorum]MBT0606832.1 helix-turn-helix domain-containing protein [Aequorivita echinoideorum]
MQSNTVQLHNVSPQEFKTEILEGVKELLQQYFSENNKEKLLTRQEVSNLLSISLPTLRSYVKRGIVRECRIGSRVLYKMSDVTEAISGITKK